MRKKSSTSKYGMMPKKIGDNLPSHSKMAKKGVNKMKCPNCGIEMKVTNKTESQMFKGKKVELEYSWFKCEKCGEEFTDVESLQNSWEKIREDYTRENAVPTPFDYDLILSFIKDMNLVETAPENENDLELIPNVGSPKQPDRNVKKFILSVLKAYDYSASDLSKMSHEEPAWNQTPQKKIIKFHKNMIKSRV